MDADRRDELKTMAERSTAANPQKQAGARLGEAMGEIDRLRKALGRARRWANENGTVSIVSMIDRVLAGGSVELPSETASSEPCPHCRGTGTYWGEPCQRCSPSIRPR